MATPARRRIFFQEVTGLPEFLAGLLRSFLQPIPGGAASSPPNPNRIMKNDSLFKFVAVIIVAGVITALVSPSLAVHRADTTAAELTQAAHATE